MRNTYIKIHSNTHIQSTLEPLCETQVHIYLHMCMFHTHIAITVYIYIYSACVCGTYIKNSYVCMHMRDR